MSSAYLKIASLLLVALGVLVTVSQGVPLPNEELNEEFRNRKFGNDVTNEEEENAVRQLDAIGGGNLLRNVDPVGNPNQLARQTRQGLDSLSGGAFGNNYVKRYDSLSGGSFGTSKRNFDEFDRTPFEQFHKKNFDEIDRAGFNSFVKKNFDEIERVGFSNFMKRAANGLLARYYQSKQGH